MNSLQQLHELGQSTWLNYMRRSFIQSGELRSRIADGIQGLTANAANFEATIGTETDYDEAIWEQVTAGTPAPRIHDTLIIHDVQIAADYMHVVYQESGGLDGYVSLELDPSLMVDAINTVAEVRHLEARINRANVMVEVPATPAGIEAVKTLTRDGVNLNITHIFSVDVYERAAQAYIEGLELFLDSHSVWRFTPTSVASFSVSAIDEAVDPLLREMGAKELMGKTAVAQANVLFHRCQYIFSGPRWEKAARRGGRLLRPKWSRTTPRNPAIPDTAYIEALMMPDSVITFSLDTLNTFLAQERIKPVINTLPEEAQSHLRQLAERGIDLDAIAANMQQEYLQRSEKQFEAINRRISRKRDELERAWQRMSHGPHHVYQTSSTTPDSLPKVVN